MTGKSVVGLALALACGLQCTHSMVPPTSGSLTAAGMMKIDVGQMILVGSALSVPIFIVAILDGLERKFIRFQMWMEHMTEKNSGKNTLRQWNS